MLNVRFAKFMIAIPIVCMMLINMVGNAYATEVDNEIVTEEFQYSDVDKTHWAYETILDLTNRDIIHGYTDGTFKPDEFITRAELAKVLASIAKLNIVESDESSFDDVDKSSVMSPYIEAVYPYLGKWRNTETSEVLFMPNNNVLREDLIMSVLKMRGTDVSGVDINIFNCIVSDSNTINDNKKPYVAYAIQEGYVSGFSDKTFRGNDYITRAQLCVMLDKVFETDVEEYIADYTIMNYTPPKPESEEVKPSYSDEDLEILARIMYCEAGSSWITDEQQLMFGNVVLNRVASPEFPNTVRGVAYQRGQYAPNLFNSYTVDQRTYNNARKLLEGYRCMPESVVFQANFRQGSGVWKAVQIPHLGTTYFCYSNHMSYYQ